MSVTTVRGQLVDILAQKIFPAEIIIENGLISSIRELPEGDGSFGYIIPGFVDAHVHVESSMLVPSEFGRLAVVHGTVATVSDPHEIANVCGLEGVNYMIENGRTINFKFNFGAPSCVPATIFETAGASLDSTAVEQLLMRDEILYLSEMMNFPGVLHGDDEVMKKIAAAHRLNKVVDGHAPGLRGSEARKYIAAGISTDHECFTAEEALDKLEAGMKILIREGSAARNFEALAGLIHDHWENMMFCSDDKHPDSLVVGHINELCARAVAKGIDVFKVLQVACVNPVLHYKLPVGLLKHGDPADFIIVDDLKQFITTHTYINGELVARQGESLIQANKAEIINHFNCDKITVEQLFTNKVNADGKLDVIEALDGQLITNKISHEPLRDGENIISDVKNDVLKIIVVNRYYPAKVAVGFIQNVGLKEGAIASSVAHDSHNIVATGVDDESIVKAVNLIIAHKGGVSCAKEGLEMVLPLPVAGLMSNADGYEVARQYSAVDAAAKELGSSLGAPFMTLSFMALLVIPHLKLSDKGLFDGNSFSFL